MRRSGESLGAGLRVVLTQQALIAAVAITGFTLLQGPTDLLTPGLSSAFGAAAAMTMSLLLAFKIQRLNRRLEQNKAVNVGTIMLGFAPRLLLILIFFWLGISIFKLTPLPMVITFALVHLGYLFRFLKPQP